MIEMAFPKLLKSLPFLSQTESDLWVCMEGHESNKTKGTKVTKMEPQY